MRAWRPVVQAFDVRFLCRTRGGLAGQCPCEGRDRGIGKGGVVWHREVGADLRDDALLMIDRVVVRYRTAAVAGVTGLAAAVMMIRGAAPARS